MVNFIDQHEVKPPVDQVFDFEDAIEAYKAATSRDLFGKIVIKID